ncbi:hypothetical protein GDO81_023707 [Engystomops pustulosus]|uniref:Uncharacterized protein n=1 Tax=Engystomops pustulosus TaxID=76066 RepID=A0AAV6YKY0_ENGPU|nr:hypothetical protein GDO81_023707 [Engystomops pustulosus]
MSLQVLQQLEDIVNVYSYAYTFTIASCVSVLELCHSTTLCAYCKHVFFLFLPHILAKMQINQLRAQSAHQEIPQSAHTYILPTRVP